MTDHVEPVVAAPLSQRRERRLRAVLALNVLIVGAQVVAGLAAHSLGLLSDAGHNLTDVGAVALSLFAVRLARRPPTAARSFGWHRSTVLAAQANAAAIIAVTVVIALESVRRLADPEPVQGGIVVVVALVAAVGNGISVWLLWERERDLNMRSALLHMVADALASVGVAGVGMVILVTGRYDWLDPLVSLGIGVLISVEAVRLLRSANDVLLESTPRGLDLRALARTMAEVPGVEEVHDLHAWSLSSDVRALSAHLVMAGEPTLGQAQVVADAVKRAIAGPYAIAHATLELECVACVVDGDDPCAIEAPVTAGHSHAGH